MSKLSIIIGLLLAFSVASAQPSLFNGSGPAFDGYDLISYLKEHKAVKGVETYQYKYGEWKLYFSSKSNLDTFKANPDKYIPPHHGYCAIALVKGDLVRPDFANFKVQDDQVLFFLTKAFFNGKTQWEKDPDKNKVLADLNFKKIQENSNQR